MMPYQGLCRADGVPHVQAWHNERLHHLWNSRVLGPRAGEQYGIRYTACGTGGYAVAVDAAFSFHGMFLGSYEKPCTGLVVPLNVHNLAACRHLQQPAYGTAVMVFCQFNMKIAASRGVLFSGAKNGGDRLRRYCCARCFSLLQAVSTSGKPISSSNKPVALQHYVDNCSFWCEPPPFHNVDRIRFIPSLKARSFFSRPRRIGLGSCIFVVVLLAWINPLNDAGSTPGAL